MIVYIVSKNDKVDEVFDNLQSAENHMRNLTKLWAIPKLIIKEVKSL